MTGGPHPGAPGFTNKRKNEKMKKYVIITAAAIVASLGVTYAANSLRNLEDQSKCENGYKCVSCHGTGWQPNSSVKCYTCKGTGANGSY